MSAPESVPLFELVLPCYNESKSLSFLIDRAVEAACKEGYTSKDFQLVLVENGSRDESSRIMDELKASPRGEWFRKVQVQVNQGYGFGLWSGLTSTRAQFVGWSHADQQCDPQDAFRALKLLKAESDEKMLAKGVRHGRSLQERFVSRVFEFLAWVILGFRLHEINAQPKVFRRSLLGAIKNPPKTFAFDLYALYQARKQGYRIKTLDVQFPPRIHGVSNWAFGFMARYKTILGMIRYMWDLARAEGRG